MTSNKLNQSLNRTNGRQNEEQVSDEEMDEFDDEEGGRRKDFIVFSVIFLKMF